MPPFPQLPDRGGARSKAGDISRTHISKHANIGYTATTMIITVASFEGGV